MEDEPNTRGGSVEDEIQGWNETAQKVIAGKDRIAKPIKRITGRKTRGKTANSVVGRGRKLAGNNLKRYGRALKNLGENMQGIGLQRRATGRDMRFKGDSLKALGVSLLGTGPAGKALIDIGEDMHKKGTKAENHGKKLTDQGKKIKQEGRNIEKFGKNVSLGNQNPMSKLKFSMPKIPKGPKPVNKGKIKELIRKAFFGKKKIIIIAILIILIVIIAIFAFLMFDIEAEIESGSYKEGDMSNIPYVIKTAVMNEITIIEDGNGGYKYTFKDKDGNEISLDEVVDNVIEILNQNESTDISYLGEDENRKALLKTMIKAEIATQYPKLSENTQENTDDNILDGNIKIQRKDASGTITNLTYIDEASFNNLIVTASDEVMNYYTLKKSSARVHGNLAGGTDVLSDWIASWENGNLLLYKKGTGSYNSWGVKGYITEDATQYICRTDVGTGNGTLNYGFGVMINQNGRPNNVEYFQKYGVDVTASQYLQEGRSTMPVEGVDSVKSDILQNLYNRIATKMDENGVNLTQNQIHALCGIAYQFGEAGANLDSFIKLYKQYGNTDQLRQNYRSSGGTYLFVKVQGGTNSEGIDRAAANWGLFHDGIYYAGCGGTLNPSSYNGQTSENIKDSETNDKTNNENDNITSENNTSNSENSDITNNQNISATQKIKKLDNFLFIGDSRYAKSTNKINSLGKNISNKSIEDSTIEEWANIAINGGTGNIQNQNVDITGTYSGISIQLGVNSVYNKLGEAQTSMKTLIQELKKIHPDIPIYINYCIQISPAIGESLNYETMKDNIKEFNNDISNYCNKIDNIFFINMSEEFEDEEGYLKSEYTDDGVNLNENGSKLLLKTVKSKILNNATNTETSNISDIGSYSSTYNLVTANKTYTQISSTVSYTYNYTIVTDIGHGSYQNNSSRWSSSPLPETKTDELVTYSYAGVDYQAALRNYTLYFDFLWAVLVNSSGDSTFINELAKLGANSEILITVYNEQESDSVTTGPEEIGILQLMPQNNGANGIAKTDYYKKLQTNVTKTNTIRSKMAVTHAKTWLLNYDNDSDNYEEYLTKSKEQTETSTDLIELLSNNKTRIVQLSKEESTVARMLKENEKVSVIVDVYSQVLDIGNNLYNVNLQKELNEKLDTSTFDLNTFVAVNNNQSIALGEFNGDFLEIARQCHAYVRENMFTYAGNSIPITAQSRKNIDCSSYVSWALYEYGYTDLAGGQLSCSGGTIVPWCNSNLSTVYSGFTNSLSDIPNIQAGDIVIMGYRTQQGGDVSSHTQIFAGYDTDGKGIWYNCGSNNAILKMEGLEKYNSYQYNGQGILYVYRVP